jgi:hypothetical protein
VLTFAKKSRILPGEVEQRETEWLSPLVGDVLREVVVLKTRESPKATGKSDRSGQRRGADREEKGSRLSALPLK